MTIKRTDLETEENQDSEEEIKAKEQAELEAQEKEEKERKIKELELKVAKAEGENEALKKIPSPQSNATPVWSEQQWEDEAQKMGFTSGQQLKSAVTLAGGIYELKSKELNDRLSKAEMELQEAKKETKSLKSRKSLESVENEFYDKNPALRLHKKTVEEFMSTYPDSSEVPADIYKKRLELARDVVKGKVKEMRTNKSGEVGSSRMESTEEESHNDIPSEFDPTGTGNEGSAHFMSSVHSNFGKGLIKKDSVEVWKKSLDPEGKGVSISIEEEFQNAGLR